MKLTEESRVSLYKMLLFYRIIRCGSIEKAVEELNRPASMIYNDLAGLDKMIGAELTLKQHKQIVLTKAGQDFFEFTKQVFHSFHSLNEGETAFHKEIYIATLHGVAEFWMPSIIQDFKEKYPDTRVILLSGPEYGSFDTSICDVLIGPPLANRSDLAKLHIKKFDYAFFAAPSYLNHCGVPSHPYHLKGHKLLLYKGAHQIPDAILKTAEITAESTLYRALAEMARLGLGICSLPKCMVRREGLKLLFDDFISESDEVVIMFPKSSHKINVIEDLVKIVQFHFNQEINDERGY